jgi:GntR family transcriptional regulator
MVRWSISCDGVVAGQTFAIRTTEDRVSMDSVHGPSDARRPARRRTDRGEVTLPLRLDHHSPLPLYLQLQDQLRAAILTGPLRPGNALPSEATLVAQTGLARPTVRHALEGLVREGLLQRVHGRGTFVGAAEDPAPPQTYALRCDPEAQGTATTRLVEVQHRSPPPDIRAALELVNSAAVVEVVWLRCVGKTPTALVRAYLPSQRFPDLAAALTQEADLYDLLARRYGVRTSRIVETIEVTALEELSATLLQRPPGSIALLATRRALSGSTPVEARRTVFAGDCHHLEGIPLPPTVQG